MTESMIEKLARAVFHGIGFFGEWEQTSETMREQCRASARAVLLALREPDEGVKVTGGLALEEDMFNNRQEGTVFDAAGVCFTAMIDHILNERQPKGEE